MDFSAAHVGVVIASYAVSALGLLALVVFIVKRDRQLAKQVADLKDN